ncbi:hypothetical protein HYQ46_013082 [Verticillium longisporum]|nr:hypothetical protein HYQ46_013082 [Verticillium longisporum]
MEARKEEEGRKSGKERGRACEDVKACGCEGSHRGFAHIDPTSFTSWGRGIHGIRHNRDLRWSDLKGKGAEAPRFWGGGRKGEPINSRSLLRNLPSPPTTLGRLFRPRRGTLEECEKEEMKYNGNHDCCLVAGAPRMTSAVKATDQC